MDSLQPKSHSATTAAARLAAGGSSSNLNRSADSITSVNPHQIFTNEPSPSSAPSDRCTSPESDYGFNTQDVQDEDIQRSFTECCMATRADELLAELQKNSPFQELSNTSSASSPPIQNFTYRFELQRVAAALRINITELLTSLRRQKISSSDGLEKFWAACQKIARQANRDLPIRSSSTAWRSAETSFFADDRQHRSVYFGGFLSFRKDKDPSGLFDFTLKPLEVDTSCRFHRKYGPSRFLVVSLPSLDIGVPEHLKPDSKSGELSQAVARFLAGEHTMLGRKWKAFYLESSQKKGKSGTSPGYKIHLFAMTGDDFSSEHDAELHQFLNWHSPVDKNLASTNLKLFQRFSLGLTKTVPTICLEPSEFIRLRDPKNHAVMNDGCARMSRTLASAIASDLGLSHGHIPTAFQGRIGGAKGLWIVVPDLDMGASGHRGFLLEVSDSQLKIKPHPKDDEGADLEKRTFEVLKYSVPGKPASLNTQLITILNDRKVPAAVFSDLLTKDMRQFHDEIDNAMHSPETLLLWVQSCAGALNRKENRWCGSFPENPEEQAKFMIESGYCLQTNEILRECTRDLITRRLTSYVERLQIKVPCSTYLFCIADPYGVLKPGEIHVSLSEVWKDPESGFQESFLDGQDVLVARLPALLASDIQRVQAVWRKELRHFKDVVVFPTQGDIPLAELLSGGDYDGDTVWTCWDMDIVRPFQNASRPPQPTKEQCGLFSRNQSVKDVFSGKDAHTQLASGVSRFFTDCFMFNLNSSFLGQCTSEHEKLFYSTNDLSSPGAVKLATLSGYLVDAAKQGYCIDSACWKRIRSEISPRVLGKPAYKEQSFVTVPRATKARNIMDVLKFDKAVPEQKSVLTHFHQKWGVHQVPRDIVLCGPWNNMKLERSKKGSDPLSRCLSRLENDISQVSKEWRARMPKGENSWEQGQFKTLIASLHAKFRDIRPSEDNHQYSEAWKMEIEKSKSFGDWSLLRASCLYAKLRLSKFVWYLAGEELCSLKVEDASEGCRKVINSIHSVYKADPKLVKRRQQRTVEGEIEESGDEFYDCMDFIPAGWNQ